MHDSSTFIYLQLLSYCFVIFCICPIYCFKPFMTLWHYLVHLTNKFSKPNYLTPSLANLHGYETFTITFTTNFKISFEIFHLFLSLSLPFFTYPLKISLLEVKLNDHKLKCKYLTIKIYSIILKNEYEIDIYKYDH